MTFKPQVDSDDDAIHRALGRNYQHLFDQMKAMVAAARTVDGVIYRLAVADEQAEVLAYAKRAPGEPRDLFDERSRSLPRAIAAAAERFA